MRCSMLLTSFSAPSAVCAIEMPSFELRMPCAMPLICAVIELLIARPAASSFAELMRLPVDRRCIETLSAFCAEVDAEVARKALTLLAITVMSCLHICSAIRLCPLWTTEPPSGVTAAFRQALAGPMQIFAGRLAGFAGPVARAVARREHTYGRASRPEKTCRQA